MLKLKWFILDKEGRSTQDGASSLVLDKDKNVQQT